MFTECRATENAEKSAGRSWIRSRASGTNASVPTATSPATSTTQDVGTGVAPKSHPVIGRAAAATAASSSAPTPAAKRETVPASARRSASVFSP